LYEYLVIGRGLMGSAAFRYLCQASANSAIVGPDEPKDYASHDGVFGAHYDEGRLTHLLGKDPVWGELGRRSFRQYRAIAEASGIQFYHPVGGLVVQDESIESGYFAEAKRVSGGWEEIDLAWLDHQDRQRHFPYLNFPESAQSVWEKSPAGYINPRALIRAQVEAGRRLGGMVIPEMATGLELHGDHVLVTTRSGQKLAAKRALVAAGAFSNDNNLLPRPIALSYKTEFIVLGQVPPSEVARLRSMPTVIYKLDSDHLSDIYMVPPLRYPDGDYYVKMGANTHLDRSLCSMDEIYDWYRRGDSDAMLANMRHAVESMLPGLKSISWHTSRCVPCYTPQRKPFIDKIQEGRLYLAAGGNGSSAYCSDAIGQLAAKLVINNNWGDALDPAYFAVHYAS
jgi:sarcosine oxidase